MLHRVARFNGLDRQPFARVGRDTARRYAFRRAPRLSIARGISLEDLNGRKLKSRLWV
jgi:hypothetical protein